MLCLVLHNGCGYLTTHQNDTVHTKSIDFAIKIANHEYIKKKVKFKKPQYYEQ